MNYSFVHTGCGGFMVADKTELTKIGEIKENPAPAYSSYAGRDAGATNFLGTSGQTKTTHSTTGSGSGDSRTRTRLESLTEEIFNFLWDYSLSLTDLQYLFTIEYEGLSVLEINEDVLQHFVEVVIPRLKNMTTKPIRKTIKKRTGGFVPSFRYTSDVQWPWFMNARNNQVNIATENKKK